MSILKKSLILLTFSSLLIIATPTQAANFKLTCTCAASAADCSTASKTTKVTKVDNCTKLTDLVRGKKLKGICESTCAEQSTKKTYCENDVSAPDCSADAEDIRRAAAKHPVVTLKNPLGITSIPELVKNIVTTALGVLGALALLMFVYGGFLWLTSGGSIDRVKKGKDVMIWAAVGLAIVFSSNVLVRFVLDAFTKR